MSEFSEALKEGFLEMREIAPAEVTIGGHSYLGVEGTLDSDESLMLGGVDGAPVGYVELLKEELDSPVKDNARFEYNGYKVRVTHTTTEDNDPTIKIYFGKL